MCANITRNLLIIDHEPFGSDFYSYNDSLTLRD